MGVQGTSEHALMGFVRGHTHWHTGCMSRFRHDE